MLLIKLRSQLILQKSHVHTLRSALLVPNSSRNAPKTDKETKAISQLIMENNGFIVDSSLPGCLTQLPVGKRVLNKLTELIRFEMNTIGGQEIEMPALCDLSLWQQTGRAELMGSELFKLSDRKSKQLCLCPTHEEIVTSLVHHLGRALPSQSLNAKQSLRLYQITKKFRDESRPKHGLLRTREFLMKDMYTFHTNEKCVENTYSEVCAAYETIFDRLNLKYHKASASVGAMGGKRSHEYHVQSPIGEDRIFSCSGCGKSVSADLIGADKPTIQQAELSKIIGCGCSGDKNQQIESSKCIEIGHTFILGDRYTKTFKIDVGDNENDILMGCYGIGVSRLIQACIESQHLEKRYPNLPLEIAPFSACIIPAKVGSKEEQKSIEVQNYLCKLLDVPDNSRFHNDVLVDDRTQLSIGSRLVDAKLIGVPFLLVLGKTVHDERVEIQIGSPMISELLGGRTMVECHTRETAVVLKQLVNDYLYAKKQKKLENYFKNI